MRTEQAIQGLQAFAFCVINVNSIVVFKHVEVFKDLIILNILKENCLCFAPWAHFFLKLYKAFQTTVQIAMINKVMIKF